MTTSDEINFAFFNDKIDEIDLLKIETDIIYDFHLESDKLKLIMDRLKSLHPNFCILCQIKYIMGKNASVQLLFRSLSPNYPAFVYTNLRKQYVSDTEYILSGTLKQNLYTLTPAFISSLKENKMIGVCFISVKLLLEKITTWIKQKRYLSEVLTTNVLNGGLVKYLSDKNLLKQRLVSEETKRNTDLIRRQVIFEQSKLPEDFDYKQDSFQTLCAKHGKELEDCSLHIVYVIDPSKPREFVIQPSFNRRVLAQSNIKLTLTITCGNNSEDESSSIFRSLHKILDDLKDTIYSLEIDLKDLYLIGQSYINFAKVLKKIPNLKILKLSDGRIQWIPFLLCLKGMTKLEELDLSDIRMLTDLPDYDSDSDDTDFDVEVFRNIWSESLKHLKGLRIAGYNSIVSYNEKVGDDDELDLVETVLPCLKDFTHLRSFGFTSDPVFYTHMERFIPFLTLENVTNITKLDLSGSNLGKFDEAESVANILDSLPNLTELNLSRCQLEMRFFEIILPAIQNLKNLISLDVSDNEDFYPADITEIKSLFNNLPVLNIDDEEEYQDLDKLD